MTIKQAILSDIVVGALVTPKFGIIVPAPYGDRRQLGEMEHGLVYVVTEENLQHMVTEVEGLLLLS